MVLATVLAIITCAGTLGQARCAHRWVLLCVTQSYHSTNQTNTVKDTGYIEQGCNYGVLVPKTIVERTNFGAIPLPCDHMRLRRRQHR